MQEKIRTNKELDVKFENVVEHEEFQIFKWYFFYKGSAMYFLLEAFVSPPWH